MNARRVPLSSRSHEEVDSVLLHRAQAVNVVRAAEFIDALRDLRTPGEYFGFQQELFRSLHEVQLRQADASRNVKRLRAGRQAPVAPSGSWETELMVFDRLDRQLRAIGDALAWRLFGFDRRIICALAANSGSGPLVGKKGLDRELGEVVHYWKTKKQFALLHDLTQSLRVGDVTVFTSEGPRIVEVKNNRARSRGAQTRRIQSVIDALKGNATLSLPGGTEVGFVEVSVQLKSHAGKLREGIRLADQRAIGVVRPHKGWAISVLSSSSPQLADMDQTDEDVQHFLGLKSQGWRKAGLDRALHTFRAVSLDVSSRTPAMAPFAIYPLEARECARLLCDYLVFESVLDVQVMVNALEAVGLEAEEVLPNESNTFSSPKAPLLVIKKGSRAIHARADNITGLLLELVDVNRFAQAIAEFLERPQWAEGSSFFVFLNERAVWR